MLILVLRSSNIAPHSLCFDFIFDILHVVMSNNELVQGAAPTTESTLTRDVLKHALAFKGNSIDLFNDAVSEVKSLTSDGSSVYPPYEYPSLYHPERATTLTKSPESGFVGRLAPAEAVAVRVLQEESLALMQSFARNFETSRKIDEILGTGEHTSQSDAMEGIVDFMQIISMASGVRERILTRQGEPVKKTLGDISKLRWYKLFKGAIEQDSFKIGDNTAAKAVEEVQKQANEHITPLNPGGATNDIVIRARIIGRMRGAELAKALYLETVDLAANILPATLERKTVPADTSTSIPQRLLLGTKSS